ncbi:PLP-dependent aminotransferase family protein [Nocardia sp. NPDC127579]|uniref:MocR-like transcription factor YczR n=1 Tax=Nocardia sp. NPDC127579 TaxID=3345402 RepID=UPI00362C7938
MATRVIGAGSLARDLGNWRSVGDDDEAGGRRSARPAYLALAEGIRLLIHDGRAPLGVALPSERDLATTLGVSRTTITSTYALLREHGYLISRQGSRSTVALPPAVPHDGTKPVRGIMALMSNEVATIDLTYAAMSAPPEMQDAYATALQGIPAYLGTHGMDPIGVIALREAVARRYTQRGLATEPDQILITLGAQHGLRLLLNVLTAPAARVLIDHPTYPNAIEAIRDVGARPVPVPLVPEGPGRGWDLDGIRSAARQTAATVAYLVPDYNNPTGLLLDDAGRAELAAIARDTRMTVVVDESMADLQLDPHVAPLPVAAFAKGSEIVTIGSASKSFWGGLRVGWIRTNPALITKLLGIRSTVDLGTPVMDQLATIHLLEHEDSILARRCAQLRSQRSALLAALAEDLPDWRVEAGPGGMSVWAQLPAPVSTALAATAPNHGVLLAAGPRFGVQGAFERFVRLPFSHPEAELRVAVKAMASAYEALTPRAAEPLQPLTVF